MDRGLNILQELNDFIDTWKRLDIETKYVKEERLKQVMIDKQYKTFEKLKNSIYYIKENLSAEDLVNLLNQPDVYFEHEEHIERFLTDEKFIRPTCH